MRTGSSSSIRSQ